MADRRPKPIDWVLVAQTVMVVAIIIGGVWLMRRTY